MFEEILSGRAEDAHIAAVLSMIAARGVEQDELLGAARAMRRHAVAIPTDGINGTVIDTCGTGGAAKTFNVSTVVAFVVAAAAPGRVHVAKHGNKSRTGRGSAEVLAQLGVNIQANVESQARSLRECGVCFCFAVAHHPAAKHAASVRRALPFPTMFNLLGPLCNPARAVRQVMGVYDPKYVPVLAHVLSELGTQHAIVLHGSADGTTPSDGGGMDELSTLGPTLAAQVQGGVVTEKVLDTHTLVPRAPSLDALAARDVSDAARIAREVLAGLPGPHADFVLVNAALALNVSGCADSMEQGVELARRAIASGAAARVLTDLVRLSNE